MPQLKNQLFIKDINHGMIMLHCDKEPDINENDLLKTRKKNIK